MDPIAERWRELMLKVVGAHRGAPILLSGGVDSGTILAAQLELGAKPLCYGHRLGQPSDDWHAARQMAFDHACDFIDVPIERTRETLVHDVREVIRMTGSSRKTAVQCCHVMMYLAAAVKKGGDTEVFFGSPGVVEDNRQCQIILAEKGEEAARNYRAGRVQAEEGSASWEMARLAEDHFGVTLLEPYADPDLSKYALSLDMKEINSPRQKGLALRAFPEFWDKGYWRKNSPMQVNSGLREWHEELLETPWNRKNWKTPTGIYGEVLREIREPRMELGV